MSDELYYAITAEGVLVSRDRRPCYATYKEWEPFLVGEASARTGFRVVQLIPAKSFLLFGSTPFVDVTPAPDPITAIIAAISNLTADDLVRLSVQRPDGSQSTSLTQFPDLVNDVSDVRCGYCGAPRGAEHQDYCVTNKPRRCNCHAAEVGGAHDAACPAAVPPRCTCEVKSADDPDWHEIGCPTRTAGEEPELTTSEAVASFEDQGYTGEPRT